MIETSPIRNIWNNVLDFLLPRLCCGCGERILDEAWLVCRPCLDSIPPLLLPICARCGCPDAKIKEEGRCANCPPGTAYFIKAQGVARFSGIAQVLVHRLKYQRRIEYAPLLSREMARIYREAVNDGAPIADIVLPVPLHSTRLRDRGFNQSALIARPFGESLTIPVSEKALVRTRPTSSQTSLKKSQRRKNVAGAFACKDSAAVAGKKVLLIDDVYTTGSTLNECARTLREAGAESVECLAYARTVID